jgi:hypothetical protein
MNARREWENQIIRFVKRYKERYGKSPPQQFKNIVNQREWENALIAFENHSVKEYKRRYGVNPPNHVTAMYSFTPQSVPKKPRTIPRNFTKNDWNAYRNFRAFGFGPRASANFISSVKAVEKKKK